MPRKRSLSPAKYWHKRANQFVVKFDGAMHYLGRDEAEAERRRCLLVAARLAGEPLPDLGRPGTVAVQRPTGPTVAEVLLVYEQHARTRYPAGGQMDRVQKAIDAAREVCGDLPAEQLGPKKLKEVRAHLLARPSLRGGKLVARLREVLASGPMPVGELDAQLRSEGWPQSSIQYARRNLGLSGRSGGRGRIVALSAEACRPPRLARNYVNSLVGCLQTAWTWLAGEELVPADRALALRAVVSLRAGEGGEELPQIVAVPPDVVDATVPWCNRVVAAMVRVQQLTGCRPDEVCRMRPCDLSRSPVDRITVPGTKPPMQVAALDLAGTPIWIYVPESHKTLRRGKRRLVPLGPRAQEVLLPFLEGRSPDVPIFSAREASGELRTKSGRRQQYGQGREPGLCYTPDTYRNAVQAAIEKANRQRARDGLELLPVWAPNQLRKLAATAAEEHSDRDTTAALLGHATPDMTAVYADQALRKAAALVARIG